MFKILYKKIISSRKKSKNTTCTESISPVTIGVDLLTAEGSKLDKKYSYFIFSASFGDKWLILSFIPEFINLYPNVRIIASETDRDLIRIFIGEKSIISRVVFFKEEQIRILSNLVNPLSASSFQIVSDEAQLVQVESVLKNGFPKNRIRHLHIVKYPYFSDLHLYHGVSYGTLLKMLLYLPIESKPICPTHYTDKDFIDAKNIYAMCERSILNNKVLFNVTSITNSCLSIHQINVVINEMLSKGFQIFINVSGYPDVETLIRTAHKNDDVQFIDIPGYLLALVSEAIGSVFGVMSGAMCVAALFSSSNILSLSKAKFF